MSESQHPDEPEPLLQWLGTAGRRIEPPTETRDAVYLSTRLAWQRELQRRRRTRLTWLAAASVAATTVGLLWLGVREPTPAALVLIAQARGGGLALRVGERYETGRERGVVLETAAGHGLRLDRDSRVRGVDATTLEIERGRMYFESVAADATSAAATTTTATATAAATATATARALASASTTRVFAIVTRYGTVRHVGTRFTVEVLPDRLAVQVRDGRVRIDTASQRIDVDAGVRVAIDASGREIERGPAARHGAAWDWVEALAPPLAIDGRSLIAVLEDIARESGRRLEFADEDVRRECRGIALKGPFIELPMGNRLFAVLATTGLEAIESGERILIRHRVPGSTPANSPIRVESRVELGAEP